MLLYHITKEEYLSSILTNGILPAFKRGITCRRIIQDKVFLTNNVSIIANEQAGLRWMEDYNAIVIEVEVDDSIKPKEYYSTGSKRLSTFEFVIDKVEVKNIIRHFKYKTMENTITGGTTLVAPKTRN